MSDQAAARADELRQLEEELATHAHALRVRDIRAQIEQHKARLLPPLREWHHVEFLSAGKQVQSMILDAATQSFKGTGEYHPQTKVGEGYYVVEDGEMIGLVDMKGVAMSEPSPEHRLGTIHTTQPYA